MFLLLIFTSLALSMRQSRSLTAFNLANATRTLDDATFSFEDDATEHALRHVDNLHSGDSIGKHFKRFLLNCTKV